jgi:hypothetical protein
VDADGKQTDSSSVKQMSDEVKAPAVKTSTCSVCAACCHSVAITESFTLASLPPAPQTDLLTRTPLVPSQPTVVPDKPPRA